MLIHLLVDIMEGNDFYQFCYDKNGKEIEKLKSFYDNNDKWLINEKQRRKNLYSGYYHKIFMNIKKTKQQHFQSKYTNDDKKQFYEILKHINKLNYDNRNNNSDHNSNHNSNSNHNINNVRDKLNDSKINDNINYDKKSNKSLENIKSIQNSKVNETNLMINEINDNEKIMNTMKKKLNHIELNHFHKIYQELKLIEFGSCLYKNINDNLNIYDKIKTSNQYVNSKSIDGNLFFYKYDHGMWQFYLEKQNEVILLIDNHLKNIFSFWIQNWSNDKKTLIQRIDRQKNEQIYLTFDKGFFVDFMKEEMILWEEFFILNDQKWNNFSTFKQSQEKKRVLDITTTKTSKKAKQNEDFSIIKNKSILLLTKQIQKILNSKNLTNFYDCQEDLFNEMKIL